MCRRQTADKASTGALLAETPKSVQESTPLPQQPNSDAMPAPSPPRRRPKLPAVYKAYPSADSVTELSSVIQATSPKSPKPAAKRPGTYRAYPSEDGVTELTNVMDAVSPKRGNTAAAGTAAPATGSAAILARLRYAPAMHTIHMRQNTGHAVSGRHYLV